MRGHRVIWKAVGRVKEPQKKLRQGTKETLKEKGEGGKKESVDGKRK